MACKYFLYNQDTGEGSAYTYEELVQHFLDGNYTDFSDIIFSKNSKQDIVIRQLREAQQEYRSSKSEDHLDTDPNYSEGKAYTGQSLINSGQYKLTTGEEPIRHENDDDYKVHAIQAYINEGMSEEEATLLANNNVKNWSIVNEDAKEWHRLIGSINIENCSAYQFIKHFEGSKFQDVAASIYDQIKDPDPKKGLLKRMRINHKWDPTSTTKLMQNVNLKATLNYLGEDIVGHFDNIMIATDGTLHVYNYVVTTQPIDSWSGIKMEGYRHKMAILKAILAHNGLNVNGIQLHLVPVQFKYSEDYQTINETIIDIRGEEMPTGQKFSGYDAIAKHFISPKFTVPATQSQVRERINKNLQDFFPMRGITVQGIQKSVDEWIKQNYTYKWQDRIKKVDKDTHTYEVFFTDDFTDPVKIQESTNPMENEELRNAVTKHMHKMNTSNTDFLSRVVQSIMKSKRLGYSAIEDSSRNRNLQLAQAFISKSLHKYIYSHTTNAKGEKTYDWQLLSNDTLTEANILLFYNHLTEQLDVVCLSNFNLRAKASRESGQTNIMWGHVRDNKASTLINFKNTYGNIEAMKTMTILNEILPQLDGYDIRLGNLKVISTNGQGDEISFDMEDFSKRCFQESIKVVKKNVEGFNMVNNFSKARFMDPFTLLVYEFRDIMDSDMSLSEKEEIKNLGFANLESLQTREQKCVALRDIIDRILASDVVLQTMKEEDILKESTNIKSPTKRRALANLYKECADAYRYYMGIPVYNEERISKFQENYMTQNRVANPTYHGVVNMFIKAADDIAAEVRKEYNPIYNFTMNFFDKKGYGTFNASVVGNQVTAFNNLYRRDDQGKILMEFRNPYETDSLPPMDQNEKTYLKKVLYTLAKIRSKIYGFSFNFSIDDINSDAYLNFVEQSRGWYFNVPLEKASIASIRAQGMSNRLNDFVSKARKLIENPKAAFNEFIQGISTGEELLDQEKSLNAYTLINPYIRGDGFTGDDGQRSSMINTHPEGFWETNVENILAHYLEKYIQVKEFNKALIGIRAVLIQLKALETSAGEGKTRGIEQTIKMTQDFVKQNIFNVSLLEPEQQKAMAWIDPFRKLVSKAYIAGNIQSAFRDTFEGMWQNTARMLTKYQTDIDAGSLASAYKEVTKASFTSIKNITIIDELCKTYRLSNLDVARISEGLTTSRGGALNIENWMYSTLRAPDFLNRMVLFIAKCMHDGSWDAFYLEDNQLKYDWKKDKRYSVFADKTKEGTKEYEEQKTAYFLAVRQYNLEHPDSPIGFDGDLPVAYSNQQIMQMRQLSNSIYGAYDKSMRAKYESTMAGMTLAMFSTWMNGMASNYFAKPGAYMDGLTELVQDTDSSGNNLFFDKDGLILVEIQEGDTKKYIYEGTGEECTDLKGMVPVMKYVPRVIQGIIYTLKDSFAALRSFQDGKYVGTEKFLKEIWADPMQKANLMKLISDLLGAALFALLFKMAIAPLYTSYKATMKEHTVVENGLIETLYKAGNNSYDGFLGPIAMLKYVGEDTNPPMWGLTTKLASDAAKTAFGDKTVMSFITGSIAITRGMSDTRKAEAKKD